MSSVSELAASYSADHVASAAPVLSKALKRAVELLGLSGDELAAILGLSASSVSRLRHDRLLVEPDSKAGQLALVLLRVFRSLDALVGSRDELARQWLRTPNADLGAVPIDLLKRADGLVRVGQYLDAVRGSA